MIFDVPRDEPRPMPPPSGLGIPPLPIRLFGLFLLPGKRFCIGDVGDLTSSVFFGRADRLSGCVPSSYGQKYENERRQKCKKVRPSPFKEAWHSQTAQIPSVLVNCCTPLLTHTSAWSYPIPSILWQGLCHCDHPHSCPAPLFTLIKADSVSLYIFICSPSPPPPHFQCLHSASKNK